MISDNDRDPAVQRLQEAYAQGLISEEEMDRSLHQVLTAETRSEIDSALASLPAEEPARTATIGAATGRIQRRGAWRVPRHLKVESAMGRVRLDLSRAVFEYPVVDIELQVGLGKAKIIVPRDAVVEIDDLQAGWRPTSYEPPQRTSPGGPTIRISGVVGMGRLKIRHARRR